MSDVSFEVVDRIGFAERWLDRAKQQCQDGDVSRGLLTLFLANAEMTHTLRTARPVVPPQRQGYLASTFAVAAALALAGVVLAGWRASVPTPAATAAGPAIVTLGGRVGSLLDFDEAAPLQRIASALSVQEKFQSKSVRRHAGGARRVERSLPRARPAPATHSGAVPKSAIMMPPTASPATRAVAPSSSPAEAAAGAPSDVELISLVLTAERTLRTQSRP